MGGAKEKDDADGVLVASRSTADNAAMRMDLTLMLVHPRSIAKSIVLGSAVAKISLIDTLVVIVASVLARRRRLMDDITLTSLQRSFFEIFRSRPSSFKASGAGDDDHQLPQTKHYECKLKSFN